MAAPYRPQLRKLVQKYSHIRKISKTSTIRAAFIVYERKPSIATKSNYQSIDGVEYVETKQLGTGNFNSVVHPGRWTGQDVAVKRIVGSMFDLQEIINEIKVIQEELVPHKNVVAYLATSMVPNDFVLVAMDLCKSSLHDRIDKCQPIDALLSKNILKQVTEGLNHLHLNRITHGNLKPTNILMSWEGSDDFTVKLSDYGLPLVSDASRLIDSAATKYVGQNCWIAKEVLEALLDSCTSIRLSDLFKDTAVDIFALGCIFHYTLTQGKHPFGDEIRAGGNILDGKYSLEDDFFSVDEYKIKLLITRMIGERAQRPKCTDILAHRWMSSTDGEETMKYDVSPYEIQYEKPVKRVRLDS